MPADRITYPGQPDATAIGTTAAPIVILREGLTFYAHINCDATERRASMRTIASFDFEKTLLLKCVACQRMAKIVPPTVGDKITVEEFKEIGEPTGAVVTTPMDAIKGKPEDNSLILAGRPTHGGGMEAAFSSDAMVRRDERQGLKIDPAHVQQGDTLPNVMVAAHQVHQPPQPILATVGPGPTYRTVVATITVTATRANDGGFLSVPIAQGVQDALPALRTGAYEEAGELLVAKDYDGARVNVVARWESGKHDGLYERAPQEAPAAAGMQEVHAPGLRPHWRQMPEANVGMQGTATREDLAPLPITMEEPPAEPPPPCPPPSRMARIRGRIAASLRELLGRERPYPASAVRDGAFYVRPTLGQRISRKLFPYTNLPPLDERSDAAPGDVSFFVNTTYGFTERLRLLVSGRTEVVIRCKADVPVRMVETKAVCNVMPPQRGKS